VGRTLLTDPVNGENSHIENGKAGTRLETIFSLLATLDLEMKLTARGKGSEKSIGDIL